MAYKRIRWRDRQVERPRTYTLTPNADGSQTLTDAPGEVMQSGTPLSAENLNASEEALLQYSIAVDFLISLLQAGAVQGNALTQAEIDRAIALAGDEDDADDGGDAQTATLGKMVLGQVKLGVK